MPSPIALCSQALVQIGFLPITSFVDDNKRAAACAQIFAPSLDELVREHPWNCALVTQVLAQRATPVHWDYAFAYTLPADPFCLRVWATTVDEHEGRWRILLTGDGQERVLVADETPITIEFSARVKNTELLDPMAAEALVYLLASKLCYPLSAKNSVAKDQRALYYEALRRAAGVDGQERSTRRVRTSTITRVRRG